MSQYRPNININNNRSPYETLQVSILVTLVRPRPSISTSTSFLLQWSPIIEAFDNISFTRGFWFLDGWIWDTCRALGHPPACQVSASLPCWAGEKKCLSRTWSQTILYKTSPHNIVLRTYKTKPKYIIKTTFPSIHHNLPVDQPHQYQTKTKPYQYQT